MNSARNIANILTSQYGVTIETASPISLIWAAEKATAVIGADAAWMELKAVNRKRERAGRMPAYPEFGSALFSAWNKAVA